MRRLRVCWVTVRLRREAVELNASYAVDHTIRDNGTSESVLEHSVTSVPTARAIDTGKENCTIICMEFVDKALSAQQAASIIPVRLIDVDILSALQLAIECTIYAYDAYFLQCTKSLSHPLITLDHRMKQIAAELNIEVLE